MYLFCLIVFKVVYNIANTSYLIYTKKEESASVISCITEHEGFESVCLNVWVLTLTVTPTIIILCMQLVVEIDLVFCRKLFSKKSQKNCVNITEPKVQKYKYFSCPPPFKVVYNIANTSYLIYTKSLYPTFW